MEETVTMPGRDSQIESFQDEIEHEQNKHNSRLPIKKAPDSKSESFLFTIKIISYGGWI
jgi:hypothetical protein